MAGEKDKMRSNLPTAEAGGLNGLHLLLQSSIGILDVDATCDEAIVGFDR
jgi:hypothetical protein